MCRTEQDNTKSRRQLLKDAPRAGDDNQSYAHLNTVKCYVTNDISTVRTRHHTLQAVTH